MPETSGESLSLNEKELFISMVAASMAHCGVHCKYPSREMSGYIKPGYVRPLDWEKIRKIMPEKIACQLMRGNEVTRDTARKFYYNKATQVERVTTCSTACTLKCFN